MYKATKYCKHCQDYAKELHDEGRWKRYCENMAIGVIIGVLIGFVVFI